MAESFNVHAAKTQLSALLERVERGEEIVVARAGRPVARLVPFTSGKARQPGLFRGRLRVPDSFFEPLPADELRGWEGET